MLCVNAVRTHLIEEGTTATALPDALVQETGDKQRRGVALTRAHPNRRDAEFVAGDADVPRQLWIRSKT